MTQIVTRFAPSPTGQMHIGSYRTAFFAYLFARKHNGKFILRIEDTDRNRYKPEYTEEIFKVFEIIGIPYDESYIQSENLPRHREMLQKLINEDKAYISKEEAKDGSGIIKDIIRFRNPGKIVTFNDLIRGEITTDTTDLGDFVIAKNIDEPLFHLAVVVDDHDEGINHVIRTDEHVANTPRQILIHEALGFPLPQYIHLPLVLAPDKTKMSKRKGAIPVIEYLHRGYLPAALLNTICLCGWNPGTEQEIFSRAELEQLFDLDKVQKAGAVFNEEKLNWFNREYMKKLPFAELKAGIMKFLPAEFMKLSDEMIDKLIPVIAERINYFGDVQNMINDGELGYYISAPEIDLEMLIWKKLKDDSEGVSKTKIYLQEVISKVKTIDENNWNKEVIKETIWTLTAHAGTGEVLWPMRFALSGRDKSPDPFTLADILGRGETIQRLQSAVEKL